MLLAKAVDAQDLPAQVLAHGGLGSILSVKGDQKAARAEDERALAVLEKLNNAVGVADICMQLGHITFTTGDREDSQRFYRRALDGYESAGLLREKAIALRSLNMAGAPEGPKLLDESLAISRQIGDKSLEANVLQTLGDNHFNRGELDAAEENYSRAIALLREAGDRSSLAYVLTSEGRLLRAHGHVEKAIPLYQEALEIQERNGDQYGALQSTNALAVSNEILGNFDTAIPLHEKALAMARSSGAERLINFELGNLASAYQKVGRDQEAISILQDLLSKTNNEAEYRWTALGNAYRHLQKHQEELEAFSRAVDIARQKNNWDVLMGALLDRSSSLEKMGEQGRALSDSEESLRVLEDVRAHLVRSDFMKRGFSDFNQKAYGHYVHQLEWAHQPGRALEVAEEARARAFLDLLGTREMQAKGETNPVPDANASPAQLQARAGSPPGKGTALDEMVMRGALRTGNTQPLSSTLSSEVAVQPFSLKEMQATAKRLNSTIVSYWVRPDCTYIWVVSPGGDVHTAEASASWSDLEQLIAGIAPGVEDVKEEESTGKQTQSGAASGNLAHKAPLPVQINARGGTALSPGLNRQRKWRELYKILIDPIEAWLPEKPGSMLTIEPYGPLLMLPFAALTDRQGQYLLERYSLHYTPALSLLQFTEKKEEQVRRIPRHYLLIADPTGIPRGPDQTQLPALPGSRREVAAVARLLPAREVTVLEGSRAGEDQVTKLAGKNTVIHFATHGVIRDDQPFDSYLALGANPRDPKEDGRLTAEKIYGMNLHADLVFLSACRSGQGKISGDGLVGLTRAFWYAGTPSVIASLWDVADEPTYRLVSSFYQSRLKGSDKSHALRSAQLHLLQELRAGRVSVKTPAGEVTLPEDPIFWAGFVLQGEP